MAARQADYERLAHDFDAWVASGSGLVEAEPSTPAGGPSPDEERQNMANLGACLGVTALVARWLWLCKSKRSGTAKTSARKYLTLLIATASPPFWRGRCLTAVRLGERHGRERIYHAAKSSRGAERWSVNFEQRV